MVQTQRFTGWLPFVALATAVYAVILYLGRILDTRPDAEALAAGMTLDLVVTVPALFWWTVVRRRDWPLVSLVPVALASLFVASRILPAEHQATLHLFELAAPAGELALFGYALHRVRRGLRRHASRGAVADTDLYDSLRAVLRDVLEVRGLADMLAYELGTFAYAVSPPRRNRATAGFSYHRRSGYGAVVSALLLAAVAEIIAVHVLLSRWSVTAAWIHLGLSAYGMLWILGDFRAITRRPIRLTEEGLELRCGIRWQATIPWHQVASLHRLAWNDPLPEGPEVRRLAPFGRPTHRLELTAPAAVTGPYGLTRRARTLTFAVDEGGTFERQLAEAGVATS